MSLSSHNAAFSVMARAGYPSPPASASASAAAADAAAPFFPSDTPHLTEADYNLPFPLASALTAQAVCKQAQHSGVMERWIGEMEEAIRREAPLTTPAAPPPSDDISPFESSLLSRLLSFIDSDAEIAALLRSIESGSVGAPTSLHEIVKRVNIIAQRSVLAPAASQTNAGATSAAAAAAAAVSQLRGGAPPPASSSSSVLRDLHRACAAAFQSVDHAAPRACDPAHPACWVGPAGIAARGPESLRDSRSDREMSCAASGLVLALQNEMVDRSNAAHQRKTQAVRAMALREMAMQIRNAPAAAAPMIAPTTPPTQLPSESVTAAALRQKRKACRDSASTGPRMTKVEPAASASALRDPRDDTSDPEVEVIDPTAAGERSKKPRVDEQHNA